MKILIVKTSSFGDIAQSFYVLQYLKNKFPECQIDWVVEKTYNTFCFSHPLIDDVIDFDQKNWKKNLLRPQIVRQFIKRIRKKNYDVLFDLQGNSKSALITFLAKATDKVGFGLKAVREKLNILATNKRFNIPRSLNIRHFYLSLLQEYFQDPRPLISQSFSFQLKISASEENRLQTILKDPRLVSEYKLMVCIGSKWKNKCLSYETWVDFLKKIEKTFDVSYLFVWGSSWEKALTEKMHQLFAKSLVVPRLSIASWQNLMSKVDLVLATDSSALHLCDTTATANFAVYGPTSAQVFRPLGQKHLGIQGKCPYGISFVKQCPHLRTCKTGSCLKDLQADQLFPKFEKWFTQLASENSKVDQSQ